MFYKIGFSQCIRWAFGWLETNSILNLLLPVVIANIVISGVKSVVISKETALKSSSELEPGLSGEFSLPLFQNCFRWFKVKDPNYTWLATSSYSKDWLL